MATKVTINSVGGSSIAVSGQPNQQVVRSVGVDPGIASGIANTALNIANAALNVANTANINSTVAIQSATAAFDKANSANLLAFNTGVGANAFAAATIAGANTAVGTGANNFLLAVIAGANTAVGAGANTWANTKLANTTGTFAGTLTIANNLIINSNVGIGINAPTAKLTVANGTSPTSQHIYGTYTDASNYERINLTANSSGHYIIGEEGGTGSARPLYLGSNNATAVTIAEDRSVALATTLKANTIISNGDYYLRIQQGAGIAHGGFWASGTVGALGSSAGAGFVLGANYEFGWSGTVFNPEVTVDLKLARDAADTLAQRRGVANQTYRLYGTYTDASNYERINLTANSSGHYVLGEKAGTGSARPLYLGANNATALTIAANGNVGIGATSPAAKLDVTTNGSTAGFRVYNGSLTYMAVNGGTLFYWDNNGLALNSSVGTSYTLYVNGTGYFGNRLYLQSSIDFTTAGGEAAKIASPSADVLTISNSTGERLRISATGNVGIGTTSPTSNLHVIGTANITSTVTSAGFKGSDDWIMSSRGSGFSEFLFGQAATPGKIALGTNGGTAHRLGFPSSGTIQWSSGSQILTGTIDLVVARDDANTLAQRNGTSAQTHRIYGTYTDASNYERIAITANTTGHYIIGEEGGTGSARPLYLGANNKATITIDTSGKTIISKDAGTVPPSDAALTVWTNAFGTSTVARFGFSDGAAGNRGGFTFSDIASPGDWGVPRMDMTQTYGGASEIRSLLSNQDASHAGMNFRVQTTSDTALTTSAAFVWNNYTTELMRITSAGNVGIGTTTPTSNLHVVGTANITGTTLITNSYTLSSTSLSDGAYFTLNRSSTGLHLSQGYPILWSTSVGNLANPVRLVGGRVTGLLEQRSGVDPQNFAVYGTYTDASNYERLSLSANSSGHYIIGEKAGTGSARPLYLGANNATAVTIDTASRVGIGTTSPAAQFHLASTSANSYSTQLLQITSNTGARISTIKGDGRFYVGSDNGYNVVFSVDNKGEKKDSSYTMLVKDTYNLLMSSTSFVSDSPDFSFGANSFGGSLEFISPAGNGMIRNNRANTTIGQGSQAGSPDKTLRVWTTVANNATSLRVRESDWQGTQESFGVYANNDTTPRLVVANGNVGIGISAPTAKLTVANGTSPTSQHNYGTYTDASNYERIAITANSSGHYIIGEKAGTGSARPLYLGANNATALTIDSVGSVQVARALTVATLPGTPLAGMIARVSDANTPVIGMTVAGGGAAYALVNYNGANWSVIGV